MSFEHVWDPPIQAAGPLSLASDATTVFAVGPKDSLDARSGADGRVLWSKELASATAPVVVNGAVCVVANGALHALDAETGRERWSFSIGSAPVQPVARGDRIVISASTGISAIHAVDGSPIWQRALGASAIVPPVIDDGRVFVALSDGRLAALDLETGETRWSKQLISAPAGLLAGNGLLYFGTLDGKLNAYAQDRGTFEWAFKLGSEPVESPVTDGRRVYIASRDHSVWAVDARNGNLRWRFQVAARPAFSPWLDEAALVVALVTGEIDIVDVRAGKAAGTLPAPEPIPGIIVFPARLESVTTPEHGRLMRLTLDPDQHKSTLVSFTRVKPPAKQPAPVPPPR